ncbi:LEM domain-containing protein 1 isoform X2 [Cavia porcellus]|uniref:LEM domain-containing protein 1 isoform X2 n=1 Tax=Cavia porcellus TaxID=10141 RepID=UPI002FE0B057
MEIFVHFVRKIFLTSAKQRRFHCQERDQTSITMVDVQCLSDAELQNQLKKLGFSPGPILPSTRKVYEKKLVQLLVPPPCASPMLDGPRKPDGPKDSDDSEELNITLKGNVILATEKSQDSKKNLIFEIQEAQEDKVKPKCGYDRFKTLRKGLNSPLHASHTTELNPWSQEHVLNEKFIESRWRHKERPGASTSKTRALNVYCVGPKPSKAKRCPARAWNYRNKCRTVPPGTRCCVGNLSDLRSQFPVCLRLAVLGIFFIVLFVYITVEKKSLFG